MYDSLIATALKSQANIGKSFQSFSIVDADAKDAVFLKAEQTFTGKKRGRKPKCTKGMDDPDSLTGWYLRRNRESLWARFLITIVHTDEPVLA